MLDDYTAGILPCQIDLEVTQIYTPCCYIIIPVLFNCLFKLTHSKVSVCVNMCVYGGVWLGWCWYGRASKGKMAWIGQQQLWKAPKRLTDLVMAAVVTWAGMPFILNTVETARNVSANSCSAGQ